MASNSISVQYNNSLPVQENLDLLLEKLISIFEVESLLKGTPPVHPLQREMGGAATRRTIDNLNIRPIPGNDFHIHTGFDLSHSWDAVLQVKIGSEQLSLPLCGIGPHADMEEEKMVIDTVKRLVGQLRASWPDATIGLLQRKQIGGGIYHPESLSSRLFEWIASKELNDEGVFVNDLWLSEDRLRSLLRHRGVSLVPRLAYA